MKRKSKGRENVRKEKEGKIKVGRKKTKQVCRVWRCGEGEEGNRYNSYAEGKGKGQERRKWKVTEKENGNENGTMGM